MSTNLSSRRDGRRVPVIVVISVASASVMTLACMILGWVTAAIDMPVPLFNFVDNVTGVAWVAVIAVIAVQCSARAMTRSAGKITKKLERINQDHKAEIEELNARITKGNNDLMSAIKQLKLDRYVAMADGNVTPLRTVN